ncbi:hypothetical protein BV898_00425 [Hypsibius exemplaris]|uniref:Uncharacterized protein n=1 Tax=Hypsibius exemplaris TaxID=2072580 RepID=A0A1W0XDC6_HYPEX|nr:hypothetical protein BV898_00425 [Hypsibius exemplaris]
MNIAWLTEFEPKLLLRIEWLEFGQSKHSVRHAKGVWAAHLNAVYTFSEKGFFFDRVISSLHLLANILYLRASARPRNNFCKPLFIRINRKSREKRKMVSERAVYGFVCGMLGLAGVIMFRQSNGAVNKEINFQRVQNELAAKGINIPRGAHVEVDKNGSHVAKP